MSKFKVGDRVTYTGDTWPDRQGWIGTVMRNDTQTQDERDDDGYYSVRFDNHGAGYIGCYGKSLTKA